MKKAKHGFLLKIIIVMFVFLCVVTIIKLQVEYNNLSATKDEIIAANEALRDEIDLMNGTLSQPKDEQYYEEMARKKLNLRLPEEIIFYNDLIN